MYNKMGKPLPQGWALGANGQESTDAPDVLANIVAKKGGGIMPLGGNKEVNGSHKGYGYGMLCEDFQLHLSMGVTSDKCCTFKDKTGICHGFAAIDPAIFGNADDIRRIFPNIWKLFVRVQRQKAQSRFILMVRRKYLQKKSAERMAFL